MERGDEKCHALAMGCPRKLEQWATDSIHFTAHPVCKCFHADSLPPSASVEASRPADLVQWLVDPVHSADDVLIFANRSELHHSSLDPESAATSLERCILLSRFVIWVELSHLVDCRPP
jgi:hypothetical protein